MRRLWIATLAALVLGSSPAWAINTHLGWNGSDDVGFFGCPNTTNYGQVITIKGYRHSLKDFSFWLQGQASDGQSMVVRAEVFAWDGTKPTGKSLYESNPRTIAYADSDFHRETFSPNIAVTARAQYVMFLTIDRDFDQCTNSYVTLWGIVNDTTYAGGTFVYLNSGGDASQWTAQSWNPFGSDLVFKASLLSGN